jgi:FlaA1/EpsC-like NDP-sugar epimerase
MEDKSYKSNKYINKYTRALFFLAGDIVALVASSLFAYLILTEFTSNGRPFPLVHTSVLIGSVIAGLAVFKMYQVTWRYISLREFVRIATGMALGGFISIVISAFLFYMGNYEYAFTAVVLISGTLLIGGFRISKRLLAELIIAPGSKQKHTIVYGGESAGEQIIRDILRNDMWNLDIQAIFDDNVMPGIHVHGIRIMGGKDVMIDYLRYNNVNQMIVAVPSMPKKELKDVIDEVKEVRPEMNIKVLPSFHSLTDDPVGVKNIRDISIEDILGREPVNIDMNSIKSSITGKTVLVTGAGGSIGSELVRQCVNLNPAKLVALDIDETELFHVENEFKGNGIEIIPCVASVTDERKMDQILGMVQPDIIFHAAAYKHVPMMESFPEEAIKVNVGGTRNLAELACKHMVDKFVMVSTDKAVNPTNVMGASKRVAEEICMSFNDMCITKFISVRFGNVLGSRGSVVPLFIEQINNGGPITVTDPEMKRYFMTIPEAVLLVMQAGSMGEGGEVFVLDMGEPVRIIDMANDLIRLHGLEPGKDILIEISGLRPGEKLFEELLNAEEGVNKTDHSEIFKAICSRKLSKNELDAKINFMFKTVSNGDINSVRQLLKEIVPTYKYRDEAKSMGMLNQKDEEVHILN